MEDGDEEPPDDALAAFTQRLPLRCCRQAHAGCGIARNAGALQARGQYLVFTDDDCRFPPDWLSRYEQHFQRTADCLVAGRSSNALKGNRYSEATQELAGYLLARCNESPEQATLAFGNNFGVAAAGFRELQGFSPRYFRMAAEDRDFCACWLAAGGGWVKPGSPGFYLCGGIPPRVSGDQTAVKPKSMMELIGDAAWRCAQRLSRRG